MKKLICLLIGISMFCAANAQIKKVITPKSAYKVYKNIRYHFSFEIPAGWKITSSGDGMDYTCYPVSRMQKEQYENYGYVFSLQVVPLNLDSAATTLFWHGNDGEYYYDPPMASAKKADRIKGSGFTGLHEIHSCRVSLDRDDPQQTTFVDGCELIYFSNGKITLRFITSGIAL